jgi:hypothetical protein
MAAAGLLARPVVALARARGSECGPRSTVPKPVALPALVARPRPYVPHSSPTTILGGSHCLPLLTLQLALGPNNRRQHRSWRCKYDNCHGDCGSVCRVNRHCRCCRRVLGWRRRIGLKYSLGILSTEAGARRPRLPVAPMHRTSDKVGSRKPPIAPVRWGYAAHRVRGFAKYCVEIGGGPGPGVLGRLDRGYRQKRGPEPR